MTKQFTQGVTSGSCEKILGLTCFSHFALIHHDHPVTELSHHEQVVANEYECHLPLFLRAGGMNHHAGELLKLRAGLDMVHIPYKGAAPALNDVMSGRVDLGFKTASGVMPAVLAGNVRAIAVAGHQRLPLLPDVPTVAEAGMPGLEVDSWNGLFAPAGTPPEIVRKLADQTIAILRTQEIADRFAAISATPVGSTPEEFSAYVKSEVEKWGGVAREANVKIN